ncbi:MAG TPA: MFS transporter [Stellaceae bacterium]|jgi:CP family cyanate transporter-like MFS transporter|nr:MFS transporter [Stellaceae bacterium]
MLNRQFLIRVALLWLSGAGLRLAILAVPPVIPLIRADLQMSATDIGVLSALPIVLFVLSAIPGSLLIARLGSRTTLIGGLLFVAVGAVLRGGSWNTITLYATTVIMGIGIGAMQPTMPVLAREWLPSRVGFATAIYSNGLLAGELLPVWLAAPVVLPLVGGSWRAELAIWAAPTLAIALLVIASALRGVRAATDAPRAVWWPEWKNPLIWRLALLLGTINAMYFATNAFLPAYLSSLGRDDLIHDALTASNLGQLPASLLIVAVASKLERRAWPYIAAGIVMTISVIGLVFAVGPWTIVWAALLGFAGAASLILALTLPPLLSAPRDVGRVSAAMFTLSYSIAVVVSLLCGAVWDFTGIAFSAFAPIALCTLASIVGALILRANRQLR